MDGSSLTEKEILLCLRYEFCNGKPIFEAYKNFCNNLGDDVMKFKDFDFWWNRFENGEFDLDYDRSQDPKTREFSDFPMDVVEKIVEKLEAKEKCIFRHVSKECREVVDKKPLIINTVYLFIEEGKDQIQLNFDNEDCETENMATVLNNPGLQIKLFSIFIANSKRNLRKLLESLNQQIHVESLEYFDKEELELKYPEDIKFVNILSYLKPGILENIIFMSADINRIMDIHSIDDLDQWKKAKSLVTNYCIFDHIENMGHFNCLQNMVEKEMTPNDAIRFKNIYLNSPTFEKCDLRPGSFNVLEVREALGGNRFPMIDGNTLHVDVTDRHVVFKRE